MTNLKNWRINYPNRELFQNKLGTCPFNAFEIWLDEANKTKITEPNAFSLATVDQDSMPDNRMLLLKAFDKNGFVFYTNYLSKKGTQLKDNPNASMLFWWPDLHRQIRIRGKIKIAQSNISDDYFKQRDRESQLSAWASKQSQMIQNYQELIDRYQKVQTKFKNNTQISRPDYWGGYILIPESFEFWQGRHSRLHERILFKVNTDNPQEWIISHLAP